MPRFRLNVDVTTKGVVFDAAASKAAAYRAITNLNDALAEETVSRVRSLLSQVLRVSTGYYASRVTVERGDRYRGVSDNRVPKGGWLEGIDPRNRSSRFKGYHTFATVRTSMVRDKQQIAQEAMSRLVQEL